MKLHSDTSQKAIIFTVTATRTSHLVSHYTQTFQYLELVAQWKPLSINTPLILQQYFTVNAVQIPSISAYDICN